VRQLTRLLAPLALSLVSLQAQSLESQPVGPGMVHHHAFLPQGPWHIQILEIDLTDTMNTLETVKADDLIEGYETTSSMAARTSSPGHTVIGAINGDFYATGGVTIGGQISKGTLMRKPYPRSVFALSTEKEPYIGIVGFEGSISKGDSLSLNLDGINQVRYADNLVLYNRYHGTSTGTNQWGAEMLLEYVSEPAGANAPILAVVSAIDSIMETGHGNMYIPVIGGAVLSAHGTARTSMLQNFSMGDTLQIDLNLPPSTPVLKELIGGTPRIIRNGNRSVEWEAESVGSNFASDRHPRTAAGFNADSTRVFFFTVDGRQGGYSVGMSLYELADYMLQWGVYQGVNLDGGGSTTMVVRGDVVNSPSDAGGERSVANALLAISKAPVGPLAYVNLPWEETFTLVETQLQFQVEGTDIYYNPVPVDGDALTWSCDAHIGSISTTGLFTATSTEQEGYIYVSHGDIHDTTFIHITDINTLVLQPDPVILQVGETQMMTAQARDAFDHLLQVDASAYTWWVSPELASISATGLVTAENMGSGSISASYHDVTATIPLTVGASTSVILEDFSSTSNFSLSGAVVNLSSCSLEPSSEQFVSSPSSGKLNYSLTTGGTSVLYMDCNIPISGTPESVSVQVYGDASGHWIRGEFKNASNEKFIVNFTEATPGIYWNNEWRELTVMLADAAPHWGNPSALLSFPITWSKIYLAETNDNNKNDGSLYFDDLKVNFITSDINAGEFKAPNRLRLEKLYPNPFNASTRFRFAVSEAGPLELIMYRVDGREIDRVVQTVTPGLAELQWTAENIPSGVYLFKAVLGHTQISGKCLLVK